MIAKLSRVPWFFALPAVLVVTGGFTFVGYHFTGDLFNETCRNERNLLTGQLEHSNCGDGADVVVEALPTPPPSPAAATEAPLPSPATDPVAAPDAGVVATGMLQNGAPGHHGSGTVELQRLPDGGYNLFLKGISVTNGPDLVVLLNEEPEGHLGGGLSLGALKANNGSQNYPVPSGTDVSRFNSVTIYCKSYPTIFAFATLEEPS